MSTTYIQFTTGYNTLSIALFFVLLVLGGLELVFNVFIFMIGVQTSAIMICVYIGLSMSRNIDDVVCSTDVFTH